MSAPNTWCIAVRPDGTGYRGDNRNYLAARGATVKADLAQHFGADPWYAAAAGMIYAEQTPEAALAGMPQEARQPSPRSQSATSTPGTSPTVPPGRRSPSSSTPPGPSPPPTPS